MQQKPKWWLLFSIFPLSVGLLWLDRWLTLQPRGHQLLEMAIVLVSFGLMALWVRASQTAVAKESATQVIFVVLPDPKCDQALDFADWRGGFHVDMDGSKLVDSKGKYN